MSSNDHPCHDPFCELLSLSRSHYLWKSKSDLSLHTTRYPYNNDDNERQTDLSPLEPPEPYHARTRYSWTHRHPTIRCGLESTASLRPPGEAPVAPVSLAQPSQPELPKGLKLFILVTCTCVAVFLQALDTTIISTAIPHITAQFHSLQQVGWYSSTYFLTTCSCQLLWGRFFTFFNLKWAYLASICIFELGSFICGISPNSTALIVGRAISGLGSAGIFAGSFIIIAFSVPLRSRGKYTALLGSMYGVAAVAGPLIGGAFTDNLSWRWCFYINLPLGAVTLAGMLIFFKPPSQNAALQNLPRKVKAQQLDGIGSVILLASITCLFVALEWGGAKYNFGNARIIVLFIVSGLSFVGWIWVQRWRGDKATVPSRIIKQRSIASASFTVFAMGGSFFVLLYYISIWFQAVKGKSAMEAGISTLPMIVGLVVGMTLAGQTTHHVGYHAPYQIASAALASIGCGLFLTWTPSTGHAHWIGYQAIFGFGQGLGWQQPLLIAQSLLGDKDVPTGTALMSGLKLLGGAIFVSVASTTFNNRLDANLRAMVPSLDPQIVISAGATNLRSAVPSAVLGDVIEAYNATLRRVFLISVVLSGLALLGSLGTEWKPIKGKGKNGKESERVGVEKGRGKGWCRERWTRKNRR